jgi:hypothetical protein
MVDNVIVDFDDPKSCAPAEVELSGIAGGVTPRPAGVSVFVIEEAEFVSEIEDSEIPALAKVELPAVVGCVGSRMEELLCSVIVGNISDKKSGVNPTSVVLGCVGIGFGMEKIL